MKTHFSFVALAGLLALSACSTDSPSEPGPPAGDDAVPDFSWPDVNATSPRYDEQVSPRDYLSQVSAWYFGHAT